MELYSATLDVKRIGGDIHPPPYIGFASDVLLEVQMPVLAENLKTGVSTRNAQSETKNTDTLRNENSIHWYALRTTYGREKKAYDYLVSKNVEAFLPTLKSVKFIDGKRIVTEESRIPNIFFARGTEEEIKSFVYDNVNLPFLRFYYSYKRIGNKIDRIPLVVPERQMNSLKIICSADSDDIVASVEEIMKFKEGQKVRITDGKFKGVMGIVARYHNQQRVGVVINGLFTVCTAYVPSAFIKIIV